MQVSDAHLQVHRRNRRAPSTRYNENKQLPSWKSDQPTRAGVLRAPAKPMVQPQLAAPSAEPALKIIHGDSDWMQGRGPQGLITLRWIVPVKGKPKPSGHWTEKVLRITQRRPLGWVESGLGRKSRLCAGEGNLGQRRRTRVLPPLERIRTTLQKEFVAGRGAPP